jgi:predicted Zn-dependent peptidase
MKRAVLAGCAAALVACFCFAAGAGENPGFINYKEYKLDNGLRVILSEDHSVPVVAVDVWYHVGSAYEEEGKSGFAHLFEHMMFQGSDNVAKREHSELVQRAGGNNNGSTTQDRTNYYQTLPSNRLNLGLWLEADRMRSLAVTPENFENQRDVVKEERRQRIDNQPYSNAFLASDTMSYDFVPYRHTVIGRMVDLDAATVEDAQAFYKQYYTPNNAVLVVVGDIDPKKTMKMVEEYFGDIPRGRDIEPIGGVEPPHTAERRAVIDDKNANVPAVFVTYTIPGSTSDDIPALELLGKILTDGESSRMHNRLVKEEKAAVVVFGGVDVRRGPGLFRFVSAANVGVDIAKCEELMFAEIEKLKSEGIDPKELEKSKVQFKADFVRSRQDVLGKAETIHDYLYFDGDLSQMNTDIDRYMAVTNDDIMRVAKAYFTENNRTVVIAQPVKSEG